MFRLGSEMCLRLEDEEKRIPRESQNQKNSGKIHETVLVA